MQPQNILTQNRLFEYLYETVQKSTGFDPELAERILNYFEFYIQFHGVTDAAAAKVYTNYIRTYNEDIRNFEETGKYPPELNSNREGPDRVAYSIILLLSCLLTPHRFRIMQLVESKSTPVDRALMIGCGPGLEIELTANSATHFTAYDTELDSFLSEQHPGADLRNELFTGQHDKIFQRVYLIEILEHLTDPFDLVRNCKTVLKEGGEIHLTTATHLPQWDHYYNFEPDHSAFEQRITEMGLSITFMEEINHAYLTSDIGSKNRYYVLEHKTA